MEMAAAAWAADWAVAALGVAGWAVEMEAALVAAVTVGAMGAVG